MPFMLQVRAGVNENAGAFGPPVRAAGNEWGAAVAGRHRGVRRRGDEQRHAMDVIRPAGDVQRRRPIIVRAVDGRSGVDQQAQTGFRAAHACLVERGASVIVCSVDVSSSVEEQLRALCVAIVAANEQRRVPIARRSRDVGIVAK